MSDAYIDFVTRMEDAFPEIDSDIVMSLRENNEEYAVTHEKISDIIYLLDEWVCTLKTAYPFVKHIPIAIAMSISRFRNCAGMCRG